MRIIISSSIITRLADFKRTRRIKREERRQERMTTSLFRQLADQAPVRSEAESSRQRA